MDNLNKASEVLGVQHAEWLNHPVTKQLRRLLDKQEERISDAIAGNSMDSDKSDYVVRLAVQLKTVKTIKQLQFDAKTFTSQS